MSAPKTRYRPFCGLNAAASLKPDNTNVYVSYTYQPFCGLNAAASLKRSMHMRNGSNCSTPSAVLMPQPH